MSDSDTSKESPVELNKSDERVVKSPVKRHRLKRKGNLLQIHPTESELKYRKNFEKFNAVNDLYDRINCTMCRASFKEDILAGKEIHSHPLLKVLMCKTCCDFYGDGEFSLDEDGEDKYCRWCGDGGKLFLCSKCICGFCPGCIKKHFGPRKLSDIKKDDDWVCYFCNPEPLWKLRTICHLAQQESESNKMQNKKDLPESTRKTSSRKEKQPDQTEELVSSKQNDKESCKNDSSAEVDNVRNLKYLRRSNRHQDTPRARGDASSSSSQKWKSNDEPAYKKRKIARDSVKDGNGFVNGNERKKEGNKKKSKDTLWDSSTSESDEDMEETKETEPEGEESQYVEKNKYAEKLKEILKIAEITSQLCFKLCKKEFRKLDKKNCTISNEKLLTNCENLKSMIILMSSSLSTVHGMIISLQKKFGKKGVDGVFEGGEGTSLMKTISHVLMDKRVKTSHLVSVVNDILNRYPYIELGAALNWDLVYGNNTESGCINSRNSNTCETEPVISRAGSGASTTNEETVKDGLNNDLKGCGKSESDSPNKVSPKGTSSTEILRHDNGSDVIESGNRSTARNGGKTPVLDGIDSDSRSGEQLGKDSASDFDTELKKFYNTSLKLKQQLLKDSSDETSPFISEMSDSSTTDTERVGRGKAHYLRGKGKPQKSKLSKEEREIRRLTNLRSLERRRISQDSDTTSTEETNCNKRRTGLKNKEADEEETSLDNISLGSKYDDTSNDGLQLPGPATEADFVKNCSTLLKEYILETTSSETEAAEMVEEKTEKPEKKKNYQSKKNYRSKSRTDYFSASTVEDSSDEDETRRKRYRKKSKSDSSPNSESSSDSVKPSKRKKRRSKVILSSTDSDNSCIALESPSKASQESPGKGRRMIRKILKKGRLQVETRHAIKLENERKKRIAERNECYKKFFPDMPNSNRLVLDFNRETGEVLMEVPEAIVKNLKPHQKEGVKFMWDNCFESLTSLEQNNGSGCILAHCMGLGKTLQVIALIATVMNSNLGVDTVLILAPLNVVNNWAHEFEKWLKDVDVDVHVYNVIKYKNGYKRACKIREWYREGGVLVLSYDQMRILSKSQKNLKNKPAKARPLCEFLLDPGPDLVICDEGHVMKNEDTSLSKVISLMQTSRRIILTGTPFQNNLLEYHSMVQFIKPNVLGTRREFMNRFGNPIRNGQFEDSTASDVKLMRARAHVLHKLLDGCIQRFNYSVLTPFLPEKHEYVISVRLSESQAKLYSYYVEKCKEKTMREKGTKLFSDFHWLQKVWTHPDLIRTHMEECEDKKDNQDEMESSDDSVICIEPDSSEKAYWKTVIKPEEYEDYRSSGKLLLLFDILRRCRRVGDKVLVFSQSLKNLDLIEYFLRQVHLANNSKKDNSNSKEIPTEHLDTWVLGDDYFRMDGSTGSEARSRWCKWFNSKENRRARLFLISTRAGSLGINLIGANRVVIFDASWNPSHDVQSIFRVYRFGQTKPCYIYRFVAEATMEEKIYERQVTKLSLEKRVLDEHQIERHYTMGNLQELYRYDPMPKEKWPVPTVPKDLILAEILNLRRDIIVSYHEHDSLLENIEEEKMTEEERKAAWEDFEKEKFMIENQLERRTFGMGRDGQSIEDITREVLRITGMYKTSGSEVPYFTPSPAHNSDNNLPFRIVNVQSLDKNYSIPSTSQHTNF